jgi:hypothetical protein
MACLHKFHNELTLEGLNYQPNTLIVGTFNPIWPDGNNAQWFYGRTHDEYGNQNNNFWDVLPRLYNEDSLINAGPDEWKSFCHRKAIAITDLIYSIDDAIENNPTHRQILSTYSDKDIATKFEQHTFVDIELILRNHPTIQNVYLTRGIGETFWRRRWRTVIAYANQNNIYESRLLTPSGYAFYQQGRYNNRNPQNRIENLADFILMAWEEVWHEL